MKKEINFNFCNLIFSSEDYSIDYEKKLINRAYNLNKRLFKIDIPKFNLRIVYSKKELDRLWGSKTPKYVSAFAKEDNIVVLAYQVFEKETKWNKNKFEEALIHEINHLFYQELRDDEYDPLWLSEGLATFMQHKGKKGKYKNKLKITKNKLTQSFENMNETSYQVFTQFVEYLIIKYGKSKLLDFISLLKNNPLEFAFKQIYKKSFEEIIKDGNRY